MPGDWPFDKVGDGNLGKFIDQFGDFRIGE